MEPINAHRLYYVIVKLVCKTHSGVTWREFRKHSQKSLKNGQNTPLTYPKRANFIERLRVQRKNSEFREQFQNSHYVRHAAHGHFYKSK